MCGYNDIVRFSDWMEAHHQTPRDELARKIDNNRRSMQWRFILGILNEMRDSFMQLNKDKLHFSPLWNALSNNGRESFQKLEKYFTWEATNESPSLANFLNIVRNRGAFHYTRTHFKEGLTKLRKEFGDTDDGFIIDGTLARGRIRFSFADTVRNAAAFGVDCDLETINKELEQQLTKVPKIAQLLNTFLQEAFAVLVRLRNHELIKDHDGHWYAHPLRTNG
jgi:hypothetical protein